MHPAVALSAAALVPPEPAPVPLVQLNRRQRRAQATAARKQRKEPPITLRYSDIEAEVVKLEAANVAPRESGHYEVTLKGVPLLVRRAGDGKLLVSFKK